MNLHCLTSELQVSVVTMVTSYMENWLLLVRHAQIDKKDNLRIFADSMNDLNDWKIDVNINSLMLSLELHLSNEGS